MNNQFQRVRRPAPRGFTMLELMVVVAILVILGGIVVLQSSGVELDAKESATKVTMAAIRSAILGSPGAPGFRDDVGQIPGKLEELFNMPATTIAGKQVKAFDIHTSIGWHGPYLMNATGIYKSNIPDGFINTYGTDDGKTPSVFDGWRLPIILQIPTTAGLSLDEQVAYARLVSAGPNGIINLQSEIKDPDIININPSIVGDDVILYLFRANGP